MVRVSLFAILASLLLAPSAFSQDPVLLKFSIAGCRPCQQMEPVVSRLQSEGFQVKRVDGNRSPEIAQRFRVQRYPTFIIMSGGQEIKRMEGMVPYQTLRQLLASAPRQPAASQQIAAPATFKREYEGLIQPVTNVEPARPAMPRIDIPGMAQQRPAAAQPHGNEPALLASTVRMRVQDDAGHSFGTGVIVDARQGEALVLTCAHLFRDAAGRVMGKPSNVTVEVYQGGRVVERTPLLQILRCNFDSDVALVSFRPTTGVTAAKIAASPTQLREGSEVVSIGCDRGADPSVRHSRVTAINRYLGAANVTATGAPVEGRSGGPLFDSMGQVVGVCNAADHEDDEGIYAALPAIHAELDQLNLTAIYQRGDPAPSAQGDPPAIAAAPAGQLEMAPLDPPVVRSQDGGLAAALAGLPPQERAALEELANRATECEVVCVIRPKTPDGKSHVLTLNQVSPEFIHALAAMQQRTTANRPAVTVPTSGRSAY